ncbi:putative outer membrane efflux protein OprM [Burkholderia pseudomallei MSHR5613]|nr:putative outer membrane efflux protein OprM [Burkholderia pseudomallei MSHR5613]
MFCPPSKIGSAMFGANDHAAVPALNRPPSVGLAVPNALVSEIFGKNAARAAPMFAFAARNVSSACMMSGRRVSRSDGSPAGMSVSRFCALSGRPAGRSSGSGSPISSTSALSACARARACACWLASAVSTTVCACRRSSSEPVPLSNCSFVRS